MLWCICSACSVSGTPLKEFAFRPLFPHERCEEDPWVDRIGWATSMFYGIVIPCFLGFLFGKQNVVMQKAKTVLMHTTCDDGNEGTEGRVKVWLQGLDSKQSFKDSCSSISKDRNRIRGRPQVHSSHPNDSKRQPNTGPPQHHCESMYSLSHDSSTSHATNCAVQDATLCKRLAAAAAACVAIDVKGRAVVELQKDAVILGSSEL